MRYRALFPALLLAALAACAPASPPAEETSAPELRLELPMALLERHMSDDRYEALGGFRPVLEEGQSFLLTEDCDTGESRTAVMAELLADRPELDYLMVEDLDGDGGLDLILHFPDQGGGYLILRRDGEEFWGLLLGERSFEGLQTNGVFVGSGGAFAQYYCRLGFREGAFSLDLLGEQEGEQYRIDGEPVDPETFQDWLAEQLPGDAPRYTGALWTDL